MENPIIVTNNNTSSITLQLIGEWKSYIYKNSQDEPFCGIFKIELHKESENRGKAFFYLYYKNERELVNFHDQIIQMEYKCDECFRETVWILKNIEFKLSQQFLVTFTKCINGRYIGYYSCINPIDSGELIFQ